MFSLSGTGPTTRIGEIGLQGGEPWRVWCDERLVDGDALEWEDGDVAPVTAGPPEAEQVVPEDRLVHGAAPAWEWEEAEPLASESLDEARPSGDDRVCEATPEYRCGPASSASENRAA